ncbi:MAG: hypothetical protein ACRD4I_11835, partial [Candidatus Angelobacter sp.]
LTEAEQDQWLDRAERFNWSRNDLRRRIRASRLANQPQSLHERKIEPKIVKIDVAARRLDHWQHAAERMDCNIVEWIITTLDRAATLEIQSEAET